MTKKMLANVSGWERRKTYCLCEGFFLLFRSSLSFSFRLFALCSESSLSLFRRAQLQNKGKAKEKGMGEEGRGDGRGGSKIG